MIKQMKKKRSRVAQGFSVIELVAVMAISLVLSAIAIPRIMDTMRIYQVSSAASQVAGAVKFARYEAIRRNTSVPARVAPSGATWVVWTDSNNNSAVDPTEQQFKLTGTVTFLTAGNVPSAGALPAAVGAAAVTPLSASASTQTISFDQRGAINFAASAGAASTVYVFYVGPTLLPAASYRAVVVMPSGAIQIWSGSPTSAWFQMN
jgi:prepilin-type N-terminal cleavage/methylation domain-containing protein